MHNNKIALQYTELNHLGSIQAILQLIIMLFESHIILYCMAVISFHTCSLLDPSVALSEEKIKELLNQDLSVGDSTVAAVKEVSTQFVCLQLVGGDIFFIKSNLPCDLKNIHVYALFSQLEHVYFLTN